MWSVCPCRALIGWPHRRPASFSAQLVCDWTAGSLLMSLHVENYSDGTARSAGKCSVSCERTLNVLLVKELQLPWQEEKGAETLERLKRKLSIWFSGGFNAVAVNYRYDWRNVSILFYLRFNVAKTTSYLVV